jgi:hypothetical protein
MRFETGFICLTVKSLYMFPASPAPIIRITQTVVTTTGISREFEDVTTKSRWEDNIKMDLQEVGGSCGDWMEVAQDRDRRRALVGTVRNLRVPKMRGIS